MRARIERSPRNQRAKARAIRRQDKAWAARAGETSITYACICARNPDGCRAAIHESTE